MLYTRTKRAAAAVLLGIGGLFVASAANATLYVAEETLGNKNGTDATVVNKVVYSHINAVGLDMTPDTDNPGQVIANPDGSPLDLTFEFPVAAPSALGNIYVRIDFTGLILRDKATYTTDPAITQSDGTTTIDGNPDELSSSSINNQLLYQVDVSGTSANADWKFKLIDLDNALALAGTTGTATASVFFDYADALGAAKATGGLKDELTVVKAVSTFSAKVTGMEATADVDKGFAGFDGAAGGTAQLAGLAFTVKTADGENSIYVANPTARTSDAVVVTPEDVVDSIALTFTGDFTVPKSTYSACGKGLALELTEEDTKDDPKNTNPLTAPTDATATLSGIACPGGFVMNVSANLKNFEDGEAFAAIEEGDYTVAYEATWAVDNPRTAKKTGAAPAGKIVRNGTTVYLPYLTGANGYVQKVTIVNRGAADAAYWLQASEDGDSSSIDSLDEARTVPGNGSVTIDVSDAVTFGGDDKMGSGMVAVNASEKDVSVVSSLKNLATGSTDTLVHK